MLVTISGIGWTQQCVAVRWCCPHGLLGCVTEPLLLLSVVPLLVSVGNERCPRKGSREAAGIGEAVTPGGGHW